MKICLVETCNRKSYCRNACKLHYERYRKTGDYLGIVQKKRRKNLDLCSIDNCDKPAITRELCRGHYRRLLRYKDPLYVPLSRAVIPSEEKIKIRRERVNEYNTARRIKALAHYSKATVPQCCCCGEREVKFLSIDHVNGGGNIHRRESGITNLAHWLVSQGFPLGYQTLCHNCNMAKGFYGSCPHETVL